jgi:hypothetical protein
MPDGTIPETLVAPFCHSPMRLRLTHRVLFRRHLPREAFETMLRTTPVEVRQNVRRIFAAAVLAERLGARLALVEGWRCHEIERPRGRAPRILTGSRVSTLLLRLLQRRGLVAPGLRAIRREVSRCTVDEVETMLALLDEDPAEARVVGIAGFSCPSAVRAHRYLRIQCIRRSQGGACGGVYTPAQALARWGMTTLTPAQRGLLDATGLRPLEGLWYLAVEGINWSLHATSTLEGRILRRPRPLEQRLAHRLRTDRPQP